MGFIPPPKPPKIFNKDGEDVTVDVREKFRKRKENRVELEIEYEKALFYRLNNRGSFMPDYFYTIGKGKVVDVTVNTAGNTIISIIHARNSSHNMLYAGGRLEIIFSAEKAGNKRKAFVYSGSVTTHNELGDDTLLMKFSGNKISNYDLVEFYNSFKEAAKEESKIRKRKEAIQKRPIKRIFHFD